jgi:hypothetical protein
MKDGLPPQVFFADAPLPAGLYATVLARIAAARRTGARVRVTLLATLAVVSGALLVSALQYAAEEFYESGFYDYASLLLSDRGFVFASWREFSYSLIESLPSLALLMLVACAACFAWSAWRAASNAKIAFFSNAAAKA